MIQPMSVAKWMRSPALMFVFADERSAADLVRDLFHLVARSSCDGDAPPGARERSRDVRADAAPAARHERATR
jgi:hypothetical protein